MANALTVDCVVGGGSGIGAALIERWQADGQRPIWAIGRPSAALEKLAAYPAVSAYPVDYSDESLAALAANLLESGADVTRLVICNGVLQGEGYRPERALTQLDLQAMRAVFEINAFLPMRVLSALSPVIKRAAAPRIAVLSARVGSLGDNQLGGWYSYRGSKAALNMMLKCTALELKRLNRNAKLVAYHPGTVDTPLSRPFQSGVDPEKLLTPERAAEALDRVVSRLEPDGELSYLDWRGETIPW